MLNDTPAARSFMTYLAGAQAQEHGSSSAASPPSTAASLRTPTPTLWRGRLPTSSHRARLIRFGAGDMMPASFQQAWWTAMLELGRRPEQARLVLESLTSAAKAAS